MSTKDWAFILTLFCLLAGPVTGLVLWSRSRRRRSERVRPAPVSTEWVEYERRRVDWLEHARLVTEVRKQQTPPRRNPPPYWNRSPVTRAVPALHPGETVVPRSFYERHFAGGAQPVYGDPDFSGAGGSSGGGGASASWDGNAPSSDSGGSSSSSGGTD